MERQFVNTRRKILKAYELESSVGGLAILAKLIARAVATKQGYRNKRQGMRLSNNTKERKGGKAHESH